MIFRIRQYLASTAASELGRRGGQATAHKARERIKAKAREMREQLGMPPVETLR